jgi:hypothetical protein
MQPGLELEEIQMPPAAPHPVVNALMLRTAGRTVGTLAGVTDLEIDPPLGSVQLDLDDLPGCLQPKGRGEEGFDLKTHYKVRNAEESAIEPPITPAGNLSSSTGNGIEPFSARQQARAHQVNDAISAAVLNQPHVRSEPLKQEHFHESASMPARKDSGISSARFLAKNCSSEGAAVSLPFCNRLGRDFRREEGYRGIPISLIKLFRHFSRRLWAGRAKRERSGTTGCSEAPLPDRTWRTTSPFADAAAVLRQQVFWSRGDGQKVPRIHLLATARVERCPLDNRGPNQPGRNDRSSAHLIPHPDVNFINSVDRSHPVLADKHCDS